MLVSSFLAGFKAIRSRPGLAILLFLVNLVFALVLSVPIAVALSGVVGGTGFDADLARSIDVVLLADILQEAGDLFGILFAQLLWMVPVVLAWKAALGVGLVHALRDGGSRSFWSGVGRYFGRGFGLGWLYLALAILWIGATMVLGGILTTIWTGEVALYRTWFVLVPTLVITGLAITDLMHDYGRIILVVDGRPVFTAFMDGIRYPIRNGTASWLYLLWFIPAALLWLFPTVIEMVVGATVVVFLVQQVILLVRAAVTVGWFGSEVSLYAEVARRAMPLIADEQAATDEAPETPVGFA